MDKRFFYFLAFLSLIILAALTSCDKEHQAPTDNSDQVEQELDFRAPPPVTWTVTCSPSDPELKVYVGLELTPAERDSITDVQIEIETDGSGYGGCCETYTLPKDTNNKYTFDYEDCVGNPAPYGACLPATYHALFLWCSSSLNGTISVCTRYSKDNESTWSDWTCPTGASCSGCIE